jgi:hypothetical protein
MKESFTFGLEDREVTVAQELSNTERAMLRELAKEGGPIWKFMVGLRSHQDLVEAEMLGTDIVTPQGFERVKYLRTIREGLIFHRRLWESVLTDTAEKKHND